MCHNVCLEDLKEPLFFVSIFVVGFCFFSITVLLSLVSSPQADKPLWELGGQTNFARQNALLPKGSCGVFKSRLFDVAEGAPVTGMGSRCRETV